MLLAGISITPSVGNLLSFFVDLSLAIGFILFGASDSYWDSSPSKTGLSFSNSVTNPTFYTGAFTSFASLII